MSAGLSACCQRASFQDPMYYDETNCRFGVYDRCAKCQRLTGREAHIAYTSPKGIRDSWTPHSEVALREFIKPWEGKPLRFKMSKSGLVPLGFMIQPESVEGA